MEMQFIVNVLRDAETMIESNRQVIDFLKPKAEAYDRLCQVLDLTKREQGNGAYGVDPLFDIRRAIEMVEKPMRDEKEKVTASELMADAIDFGRGPREGETLDEFRKRFGMPTPEAPGEAWKVGDTLDVAGDPAENNAKSVDFNPYRPAYKPSGFA